MRCKVGDLVVITGGVYTQFIGHVVRIVEPSALRFPSLRDFWEVDPPKFDSPDDAEPVGWWDQHLRPLRPDDGQDETLTWCGKPQETPADFIEALQGVRK